MDDIMRYLSGGQGSPEPRKPLPYRWASPADLDLTEADEQLITAVIEELAAWRHPALELSSGTTLRVELQLGGVTERVKILIDAISRKEPTNQFLVTFKVRIIRSGMRNYSLTLKYSYDYLAAVTEFTALPDQD